VLPVVSSTPHRRRGPKLFPRLRLNPELLKAARRSGLHRYEIAMRAGIRHDSLVSTLIHSLVVAATPRTLDALERIADVVRFDRSQLFIDDEPELQTVSAPQIEATR